jgi:hypothetical protein
MRGAAVTGLVSSPPQVPGLRGRGRVGVRVGIAGVAGVAGVASSVYNTRPARRARNRLASQRYTRGLPARPRAIRVQPGYLFGAEQVALAARPTQLWYKMNRYY